MSKQIVSDVRSGWEAIDLVMSYVEHLAFV